MDPNCARLYPLDGLLDFDGDESFSHDHENTIMVTDRLLNYETSPEQWEDAASSHLPKTSTTTPSCNPTYYSNSNMEGDGTLDQLSLQFGNGALSDDTTTFHDNYASSVARSCPRPQQSNPSLMTYILTVSKWSDRRDAWQRSHNPSHPNLGSATLPSSFSPQSTPQLSAFRQHATPIHTPSVIPSTPLPATVDDENALISAVTRSGTFKCYLATCMGNSFGRLAELKRHFDTTHAALKPEFWCPVADCQRSEMVGLKAFTRQDKLKTHMCKMHHLG